MKNFTNRWLRLLRHRWRDESDVHRAFSPEALTRIEQHVADSERRHTGEIRVCIEAGLPLSYVWRNATARERAIALFGKLRVWDTEDNNGVLIYLLLADQRIEIVADRGLNRHIPPEQWASLVCGMAAQFRTGHFEAGLLAAIDLVDRMLTERFPATLGQVNPDELPNAPVLG
jgi:uncharacterized membrane protein